MASTMWLKRATLPARAIQAVLALVVLLSGPATVSAQTLLAGGRLQLAGGAAAGDDETQTGIIRWHQTVLAQAGRARLTLVSADTLEPMPTDPHVRRAIAGAYVRYSLCYGLGVDITRIEEFDTRFGTKILAVQTSEACGVSSVDEFFEASTWLLVQTVEGSVVAIGIDDASDDADTAWSAARALAGRLRPGRSYRVDVRAIAVDPHTADFPGHDPIQIPASFVSDFDWDEIDATSHRFHRLGADGTPALTVWYYASELDRPLARHRAAPPAMCGVARPPTIGGRSFRCFSCRQSRVNWTSVPQPQTQRQATCYVLESERTRAAGSQVDVISIAGPVTSNVDPATDALVRSLSNPNP